MSFPVELPPNKASETAPDAAPKPPARNWKKIAKATHLKTQSLQQQYDALKAENKVNLTLFSSVACTCVLDGGGEGGGGGGWLSVEGRSVEFALVEQPLY
jgi:hypothetical protein